ncbi:DUF2034 domain-containing protein [Geobacter sp. FeAm09]|uniref:DUF2034 domain-containing protein n=1 Tax=Geobacter sp. FeAm09 TaxID=2597769 RepID=UPI0011EFBDFE|nr:DUF2034 domain-containing protein [Geobacter sp. FeAm09]QEM68236.1 DUF2034 domain-containing protein [Geobacter sp. FeAm09]
MIDTTYITEFSERMLHALEWKRFEILCCEFINMAGYKAKETSYGADGGIDIVVKDSKDSVQAIIQCKAWNTYTVGIKHIRELYGIMMKENVKTGVFITTSKYTKEAQEFAEETKIQLVNGAKFVEVVNRLPKDKLKRLIDMTFEGDYSTPTCPKCGVKMVLRNTEKPFWGCANFGRTRCQHKFFIKRADVVEE